MAIFILGVRHMDIYRKLLATIVIAGGTIIGTQSLAVTAPAWGPVMNDASHAHVVPVVNDDQLKGNWKQFKGELKKKWARTSRMMTCCTSKAVQTSWKGRFKNGMGTSKRK
jgi:hypothetical protein